MEVSTVRFFTYPVTHDLSKADDEKNFHGILTLENFDINTNDILNLKTWLEANIVLNPAPANLASVVFEDVDSGRIPTPDKKIPLPFKIQLSSPLGSDHTSTVSFATTSIVNSNPTYFNLVKMIDQPQSLLGKLCDPNTQVSNGGQCKNCHTETEININTPLLCNSIPTRKFFTYTVVRGGGIDDSTNFHAILTLNNFDINTNKIPNLKTGLETNIVLTNPNLTFATPAVVFDLVPANQAPVPSK